MKIVFLQENAHILEKDIPFTKTTLKKEPNKIFTASFCKKNFKNVGNGKISQGKGWNYNGYKIIPVGYTTPNEEEINPNSHSLPNDDINNYFGDILIYALNKIIRS